MDQEYKKLSVNIRAEFKRALLEEKAQTDRTLEDIIDEILSRWHEGREERPRTRGKPGRRAIATN